MKSVRILTLALGLLAGTAGGLYAQEGQSDAAAAAARQEAEERYKRLSAAVEDLLGGQATLQKRVAALAEEAQNARDERNRAGLQYATQEQFRRLEAQLKELDRKREEDRKLILEEIRRLAAAPPPEPARPAPAAAAAEPPPRTQNGYEYEIKSGDTLLAVVNAYRAKGVKVTLEQVRKANPNLKEKSLTLGQKVFIPDSALP